MIWTEGVLEHVNQAQVLREELERNEKNPFLKQRLKRKMAFPVEELRATTGRVNWKAQAPTAPSGLNKTDPSFLKVH